MTSVAEVRRGLVFWEQPGRAYAGVTGPRTGTAPEGATFTGIGLPDTTRRTFRLDGARRDRPRPGSALDVVGDLLGSRQVPAVAAVLDGNDTGDRRPRPWLPAEVKRNAGGGGHGEGPIERKVLT
jgi:hypothetical protein